MEHFKQRHSGKAPAQPVDGLMDNPQLEQQQVDRSEAREQLTHADGSDERRQDQRNQNQSVQQTLAGKFVTYEKKGQREADQGRKQGHGQAQIDAVGQDHRIARTR